VALRVHLRGDDRSDPVIRRAHRAVQDSYAALSAVAEAVNAAE
jgi:hypothetical protein